MATFAVKRFKATAGAVQHQVRVKDYGAQNGGCLVECESHDKCDMAEFIELGVRLMIEADHRGIGLNDVYMCKEPGATTARVTRIK